MIDLTAETPLSLSEAARQVPPVRAGRPVHLSCILRWILSGAKGPDGNRVHLRGARLGGRWITSAEAIQEFMEALTPAIDQAAAELPTPRTTTARQRASDRAARELSQAGI